MLLEEAKVKIPRAIGIGLIIYFGLVLPGREIVDDISLGGSSKKIWHAPPVPQVYSPEVKYEQN